MVDLDPILNNRVTTILTELSDCYCLELAKYRSEDMADLCFCGIIAGDAPYDMTGLEECSDGTCGQAWVRLGAAYPASVPGQPDESKNNMSAGLGIDIELGVMRCYTIPDDGEGIPADEMLLLAAEQHADMLAGMRAVNCCELDGYNLATWTPAGPEGGIIGGFWVLSILLD